MRCLVIISFFIEAVYGCKLVDRTESDTSKTLIDVGKNHTL